jgi:hypothetical protein
MNVIKFLDSAELSGFKASIGRFGFRPSPYCFLCGVSLVPSWQMTEECQSERSILLYHS